MSGIYSLHLVAFILETFKGFSVSFLGDLLPVPETPLWGLQFNLCDCNQETTLKGKKSI